MRSRATALILAIAACALLALSLRLPLWQMTMEAPQYQGEEALHVRVYPGQMSGDLDELDVLNSYIGVHVPQRLSQFNWLPWALLGGGALGVLAAALPSPWRKRGLFAVPGLIALALTVAAVQAQRQMHEIGHNRDRKTTLVGVKDFSTPLLGRTKVAQFTITSFFDWGALLVAGGLALQLSAAWLSRHPSSPVRGARETESNVLDEGTAGAASSVG